MAIADYQAHWKKAKAKFPAELLKVQQKVDAEILKQTKSREKTVQTIATLKAAKKKTSKEDETLRLTDNFLRDLTAGRAAVKKKREKTGVEPASKSVDQALKAMEARIVKGKIDSKTPAWKDARAKYQSALAAYKIAMNKNAAYTKALEKELSGSLNVQLRNCAGILADATAEIAKDIEVRVKAILGKVQ